MSSNSVAARNVFEDGLKEFSGSIDDPKTAAAVMKTGTRMMNIGILDAFTSTECAFTFDVPLTDTSGLVANVYSEGRWGWSYSVKIREFSNQAIGA